VWMPPYCNKIDERGLSIQKLINMKEFDIALSSSTSIVLEWSNGSYIHPWRITHHG
jgi:hypothetical protein